jgi:hypothetical protein
MAASTFAPDDGYYVEHEDAKLPSLQFNGLHSSNFNNAAD